MSDEERVREHTDPVVPDVLANPGEFRVWSGDQREELKKVLLARDEQESSSILVPEVLPPEAETAIEVIEAEHAVKVDETRLAAAGQRLSIVTGVLNRVQQGMDSALNTIPGAKGLAKFLDLHTIENVVEFALEVVPYVGAIYAVIGHRLDVQKHPETQERTLRLEPISWTDRGLYLAGELLVSGHVLRGVKNAVFKKGAKQVAIQIGKETAVRAGENLARRAKKGARKAFSDGKDKVAKGAKQIVG